MLSFFSFLFWFLSTVLFLTSISWLSIKHEPFSFGENWDVNTIFRLYDFIFTLTFLLFFCFLLFHWFLLLIVTAFSYCSPYGVTKVVFFFLSSTLSFSLLKSLPFSCYSILTLLFSLRVFLVAFLSLFCFSITGGNTCGADGSKGNIPVFL